MHKRTRILFMELVVFLCIVFTLILQTVPSTSAEDRKRSGLSENMLLVRGGCFQMGDIFRDIPSSEKPVHEVCVDDFYIGKYEVTVGEFRMFTEATGYRSEAELQDGCHSWVGDGTEKKIKDHYWDNTGFPQTESDPVVCISWNDAYTYIQWLNKIKSGSYRLLTEAEWEYAARSAGKEHQYSWGNGEPSGNVADESALNELSGLRVWKGYRDGYVYTAPVGSFRPNDLGIYDMSGNAYEWVGDWHEKDYYQKSPRLNPRGGNKGTDKILRGGAWDLQPDTARTTSRYWNVAGARAVCMGFRLAHPAN